MKKNLSLTFKRESEKFWGLFKLVGKSFYRDWRGPFFTYSIPIFFLILFYYTIGGTLESDAARVSLLFSFLLIPGLTIVTSLGATIVEWKNSVFLKRIDITGIKKPLFLSALWSFYFLTGLSGILAQFCIALVVGNKLFVSYLASVQWGYFILGIIYTIILAIAMSTFLGGLFSNEGLMQGIAMIVYFISLFLSGVMLYPILYETNEFIRIITYLIPQKYASFLVLMAQDPNGLGGPFNNANPSHPDFTAVWQLIVGGLLFIIFFFVATNFTFKWTAKK